MSDEDAPGAEEATQEEGNAPVEPPADSPTVDWDSDDNPYRQRYNEVRPQYDRYQNIVNSLDDPETQTRLMRMWGYEPEDADDQPDDLDEPLTKAEWMQWQAEQQAQAQAAQQANQMLESDTQFAEQELSRLGISDEETDAVLALAIANRDEQGRLGIEKAHQMLSQAAEARHQAYLKSKRAPKVPTGTAGTDKFNPRDEDQVTEALAAVMAAEMDDEG